MNKNPDNIAFSNAFLISRVLPAYFAIINLKTMKKPLLLLSLVFVFSCYYFDDKPTFPVEEVMGYKPVYASVDDYAIEWREPLGIKNPGKIYVYNNLLLVNDRFAGVHVINNSDPAHPEPIGFISIPGNIDMAIKNNVLYADNQRDLVAIDLSALEEAKVMKRFEHMFPEYNLFPEERGVYFECVDTTKGVVVGWEKTILKNPKCYR